MSASSLTIDASHTVYACIPNPPVDHGYLYPLQDFTFQAWIKTNSSGVIASNQYRPASAQAVGTASYGYWSLAVANDGHIEFQLSYYEYMPQDPVTHASTPANFPYYAFDCLLRSRTEFSNGHGGKSRINDNRWHRIEATRKGYELRIYVDGVLVAARSFKDVFSAGPVSFRGSSPGTMLPAPALTPSTQGTAAAPLYIGWDAYLSGNDHANNRFSGSIDDARLYGKALSRTDAAQAANFALTADAPHLLGRWAFDSDSSTTPVDATGHNTGCSWSGGRPQLGAAGFTPPTPRYLRLAGSNSGVKVADISTYRFAGDFTVQAWVRPDVGQNGALVSRQSDKAGGWTLLVEANGAVTFYLRSSNHEYSVTTTPAALYDGNWHHVTAVRKGASLLLYVDGALLGTHGYSSIDPMSMNVGGLYFGTNDYSGSYAGKSAHYSRHVAGDYDEVRLWSRALTLTENAAGMFHAADIGDHTLVGYWPFDDGSIHDTSASNNNTSQGANGASFAPAPFDFTPLGKPYLLTQSCLMQEYLEGNGSVVDTTTYRVVVTARTGNDGARQSKLKLWSDTPVDVAYGKQSATLSHSSPIEVDTTGQGTFVFSLRARQSDASVSNDDTLYCPGIYIRADFMSEGEQIFISPDRQLHAKLASIDGNSLKTGINGGPALLDGSFSSAEADAVAGAINDIMTTASHHGVRATGSIDTSSMKAARARDSEALQAGLPTQPLYLSRTAQVSTARQDNHLVRSHYLPANVAVERTAVSGYRTAAATRFDYQSRTFSEATASQIAQSTAKSATVAPRSDSGSWWRSFVDGALHVVESIVETVVDAATSLRATVVHMVQGVQQAFTYVIQTVEDAADYLKGMLGSLGVAATQVIEFCRAVFSWQQYGPACGLLLTYTEQMYQAFQAGLAGVDTLIDQRLMSWKSDVDAALDQFLDNPAWSELTLQEGAGQALAQPAGDVQSNYLGNVLCDHIDQYSSARPTATTTYSAHQPPDPSHNDQFMGFLRMLNDGRGLLSMGIGDLVRGLKRVLDWVFDMAKTMVDGLFSFLEGALESLWRLLDTQLPHIPILTNLFVHQLMLPWTPRTLFCMIGAVASSLAYKVAKKDPAAVLVSYELATDVQNQRVYYNAIMRLYASLGIPVAGASQAKSAARDDSSLEQAMDITSYVLSGTYSAVTCVWGITAVMSDVSKYKGGMAALKSLEPAPGSDAVAFVQIGAALIANLTAFPLTCFTAPTDPRSMCELPIFLTYAGAFVIDLLSWIADPGEIGSMLASFGSGVTGALALAGSIVLAVADFVLAEGGALETTMLSLKLVQNVLGSCTLLSQFCYAVPITVPGGPYIYAVPIAVDAAAYQGNAALNVARLVSDAVEDILDTVR